MTEARVRGGMRPQPVSIVGAGLAGALLAVLLARRGFAVTVYDKRPDPRDASHDGGRSINLALAARGIRALEHAAIMEHVRPFALPMRGRCIHVREGGTHLQPYGQRPHEINYSVGRAALNRTLVEEAARHANVTLRFAHSCLAVRPDDGVLELRDEQTGDVHEAPLAPSIATDGAGSAVRRSLEQAGYVAVREELLDHDYKELTIPPVQGRYAMDSAALHIWPRGGFMLIALPNPDASFTATLFLPKRGAVSFEALQDAAAVRELFAREFADVLPLMPAIERELAAHPRGEMGTIRAGPWHVRGDVLLLGDAAHAIVPFHGQGMNAAFEDCVLLDALLDRCSDWQTLFGEFERIRRPDAAAIAAMALENYLEMRDTVLDPRFQRQKALALELERRHPDRFIPRYSMVMFHPEIGYAEAQRRGAVQSRILDELDAAAAGGTPDFDAAARLVEERLPPLSTT
ncbi:MAG TPA: NAD(P)/FAD-dependent oxidoreductase [Steroidobacteraceae bacterium]|nr:NAD(P)/FAD-dependent oxidoreductase [Steroidobacteraceae bacterium]